MKPCAFILLLLFLLGSVMDVCAQEPAKPDRAGIINAAKEMMQKARYCTLVTLDRSGQPQARVVDPFPPEEGMVIWIATNPVTRKVAEIKRNPRVTLCYVVENGGGYVTLIGKAQLVNSLAEKEKHWKKEWAAFYQDTYKGNDYMLIRVQVSRMEVVSYAHQILNDPKTWVPVSVTFP
ncbi:MAG: pyridoxamine 5'-phosphate oxidase family protein [Blastocatellia bacterium]|nr:pyridoxamine 5'-phosphate oxidase family protein [Blastocatellia bacterium]